MYRIFIVEDDEIIAGTVKSYLEKWNYTGFVWRILTMCFTFTVHLWRTQYNCCLVFGYGERTVCDNRNIPVIAYQRHFAL